MVTVVSGFPAPDRAAESSGLSMLFRSKDAMRRIVLPLILTGLASANFATADEKTVLDDLRQPIGSLSLKEAIVIRSREGEPLRKPENLAARNVVDDPEGVRMALSRVIKSPNGAARYRICHNPLYFEDPNMERCGEGFGIWTDAVSATRLFGRTAIVPYLMAVNAPDSKVRALPLCPSCQAFDSSVYVPVPDLHGVTAESIAVVGLIFLIP